MTSLNRRRSGEEGIAMIAALIVLILATLLMGVLAIRVLAHNNHVTNYTDFKDAYHGMESAMARSLEELTAGDDGWIGVDVSYGGGNTIPTFESPEVTPLTLPGTDIEYFAYVINWSNDGVDNLGNGTIDDVTESTIRSIHVLSRVAGVVRRGVGIFGQEDPAGGGPSIWDNAIFGGPGDRDCKQQTIFYMTQGNDYVKIHGPVHILGDDIKNNDTALNLTKDSYIRNSYDGLPASITDNIPILPQDGDGNHTLDATLRVKNGAVHISTGGSHAWVGQPDNGGNNLKEFIDGIYVNDGFTGMDTEGVSIFSDNGSLEPYETELGNVMQFPTYADDGGRDHMQYYLEGFDAGGGSSYQTIDGIVIEPDKNYYWNASDGVLKENTNLASGGMPNYADLETKIANNEYFLWWDANKKQMVINGRIAVEGDFSTNLGDIYYHGKGTIMTMDTSDYNGSVQMTIKSSLIPRTITDFTNGNPAFTEGAFPTQNLLGLMSSYKMTFDLDASKSRTDVYGAFYCQDLVEMDDKGNPTTFIGGVASNRFKVKGHARFVHVPELDDSWTDDMRQIGSSGNGGVGGATLNIAWYEVGFNN